MRKRLLVVFLVCMMFLPLGTSTTKAPQEISAVPSQETQQKEFIPRVYGQDYTFDIFSSFTSISFRNYVIEVTANGTRHALDATDAARPESNNYQFRNWLLKKLYNISGGRLELQVIEKHLNVIGKLPGYLPGNNSAIVIAGHYDSWFASHGANEGAAGIAVLLELVEKLSKYEWPLDIYFVAANSRYVQWGPFGSGEVANWMFTQGIEPMMIYTIEALLVQDPNVPQNERLEMVYTNTGMSQYYRNHYWADLSVAMSKNYGDDLITAVSSSDFPYWGYRYLSHTYYVERGYMNTLIGIESGFIDPAIRTVEDVWTNPAYRYNLGAEMTAAIGGSIAFTMSREYGKPVTQNFNFELPIGESQSYYLVISAPTTINLTARWFGGNASFSLQDPLDNELAFAAYPHTSAWNSTDIFSQPVVDPGLYRLNIENIGMSQVGFELHYSYDTDTNGNGVMDSEEYWIDSALFALDDDGDTLSNAYEIILGTDPQSNDSDHDSMPDLYEIEYGFDPTDPADAMEDADSDSLSNLQEYLLGLDPLSPDSDNDALPDAWEVEYGLNPLFDDSNEDPDHDEKTNLDEYLDGTDPLVADIEPQRFPIEWIAVPSLVITLVAGFYAYNRYRERTWTEY